MTKINNIWYNITTNNKKTLKIKTQRKIAIKQPKEVVKEIPKMSSKKQKSNKDENLDYNFEEDFNDYDFEDDEDYSNYDYEDFDDFEDYENFEEYELQQKETIIEEIKEIANDKVEKNKTYEQYVQEKKNEDELLPFLGPQIITKTSEEINQIKKDLKKYIIENQEEILRENILYMPDSIIQEIANAPKNGIIEIDFEEDISEIVKIVKYELLKNFGIAFIGMQENKVVIHLPLIKEMKQVLQDKEIMDKQKKINEKTHIILGICELHGAIKTKQVYNLMEEFYGKTDKEQFAKFLIMVCEVFGVGRIKIDKKTGSVQFIYENWLDEEMAKKIIKVNKEIKAYKKEEYLKYGTEDYLINTKGYKRLKEQFDSDIFDENDLFELINNLVIPYTIEARMSNKNMDEIMKAMERQLVDILGEEGLIELGLDTKEIEKSLKEIVDELPKWINN